MTNYGMRDGFYGYLLLVIVGFIPAVLAPIQVASAFNPMWLILRLAGQFSWPLLSSECCRCFAI